LRRTNGRAGWRWSLSFALWHQIQGALETRREQSSGKAAGVSTFPVQNTGCRTPLPRALRAAMLPLMLDSMRNPVGPFLRRSSYRCTHETLHQLQTCRVAQAGRS
jgi:hypothetical protein